MNFNTGVSILLEKQNFSDKKTFGVFKLETMELWAISFSYSDQ